MVCSSCISSCSDCRGTVIESIGIEHASDNRIRSIDYNSTQENIILHYLKKRKPDILAFNAGLHELHGMNAAILRKKGESEEKWNEYRLSFARSAVKANTTKPMYRQGLEAYVSLLKRHLPETQLVWIRTTCPKTNVRTPKKSYIIWDEVTTLPPS